MRSACPTAMTTSRLTSRSLPTRSSSFDLASGRITYRSKSKLTVDAVVTFSGFGAAFGGAGGGGGGGGACGAGAGAGAGAGSGVDAQPAKASRAITDSAVLSLLRSEEHTSELQSLTNLVCRLLLEKKNKC